MKRALRFVLGTTLLLMLGACRDPSASHGESGHPDGAMELKIHTVPPEQTAGLAQTIGNALGKQASVTIAAPGQLLVYAPRDTQASIDTVIASLGKPVAAGTGPVQVGVRVWIVDAMTGPGADDPALKALAPSFESLRRSMGPLHFRLDQTTSATAAAGSSGSSVMTHSNGEYSRNFSFRADAIRGDSVMLQLAYQDHANTGLAELRTEIDARLGHYVVLAQAPGGCPPAPGGKETTCPDKPALRLLVVRVDRLDPPA